MKSERRADEWSVLRHDHDLQVAMLDAHFTSHAFTRHWHDYYVIGLVEAGAQSFWYQRSTYTTPRGGLILINPGEAHTGEAASAAGFRYRALYPTLAHVSRVQAELELNRLPLFSAVRIDNPILTAQVRAMHMLLERESTCLERETHWIELLTGLFCTVGGTANLAKAGAEPRALARARAYLEAHFAERVTLEMLAAQIGLSPYHLVRVFRRTYGVPPHTYLESIRIRKAQTLLESALPLAEIAYATGFSSQSHFTSRFRMTIGVTPGHYRTQRARL